ncbi:oxidoreductase [Legionella santicrucis]|uniref:Oxidoreductase n=1 Tax=Legionella santicrucis TaxID=45074 RepID=A0A0W0YK50_9GAMM|nr:SDR family NAD(P)-dependent oxidoreductase [Legionella santicrucis]KTD56963.1 oxidoreductase [Legionella santicrucis]
MTKKTAIVVGGTRGLGLGFVGKYLELGYKVIATHRATSDLTDLINYQEQYGENLVLSELDLTNPAQIQNFTTHLSEEKIDLLILNAGTTGNDNVRLLEALPLNPETFWSEYQLCKQVYLEGPLQLILGLNDKLKNENACIVYLTSPHALGTKVVGLDAFAMTKAAGQIMIYSRCKEMVQNWADTFSDDPEKLAQAPGAFAISPGWVKTDMGGKNARLTVNESVSKMVTVINQVIADKKFNAIYSYTGALMNPGAYTSSDALTRVIAEADSQKVKIGVMSNFSLFSRKEKPETQQPSDPLNQLQN